jgi:hypothetical protein
MRSRPDVALRNRHRVVPLLHSHTHPALPHREPISPEAWEKRNKSTAWILNDGKYAQAKMYPERVLGLDSREDATLKHCME